MSPSGSTGAIWTRACASWAWLGAGPRTTPRARRRPRHPRGGARVRGPAGPDVVPWNRQCRRGAGSHAAAGDRLFVERCSVPPPTKGNTMSNAAGTRVHVKPVAGHIGAEISGVDLKTPLGDAEIQQIRAA